MLNRRAALGVVLAVPSLAAAQPAWPNGPIRLVAPFPPGGSVDTIGRLLQPHLQASLGVPVLVENRGGASGSIGTGQVARSPADGNTWVLVFDTHVVNPALIPNMGFDTQRDLAPVLLIGTTPMMIAAHRRRPWQALSDMLAAARARPDSVTYGTVGNGSLAHLAVKLLEKASGSSLVHVPYRGGGPLAVAVVAGEVDLVVTSGASFVPHLQSGTLRALASTGAGRAALAPEAPTLAELGIPVRAEAFWGVLGPAATPAPIRARFEAALREALAVAAVRERISGTLGIDLAPQGPEAFAGFLAGQIETWGRVVRENGIRAE